MNQERYTVGMYVRQAFIWNIFLTFLMFLLHGYQAAWWGLAGLALWYFTGGVRAAMKKMDTSHIGLFHRVSLYWQLIGLAITQRSPAHLFEAYRQRESLIEDVKKVPMMPAFEFRIRPAMLITIPASIVAVIILELIY